MNREIEQRIKLEAEQSYPFFDGQNTYKADITHEAGIFIAGAKRGYEIAMEEIDRLKILLKESEDYRKKVEEILNGLITKIQKPNP